VRGAGGEILNRLLGQGAGARQIELRDGMRDLGDALIQLRDLVRHLGNLLLETGRLRFELLFQFGNPGAQIFGQHAFLPGLGSLGFVAIDAVIVMTPLFSLLSSIAALPSFVSSSNPESNASTNQ